MGHVSYTAEGAAPAEFAFEYVADYRNLPRWVFGVKHYTPVGEQSRGVGAVFDSALNLGPMTLHLRGEVIEWEDNAVITLRAVKGVEGTARWTFEPIDAGHSRIGVVLDYRVPGGIAGRALDRVIQAIVGPTVKHAEKHLRHQIESAYAASKNPSATEDAASGDVASR
ncbi:SRPBCC family protein [Nocardia arthritidis]|uniref:SRPBCC family protein n=1 Tax=Nocardia arthritidis TaxID=228602 RepID=A0A6G9YFM3_9NOCA|nr:SRPBCC family protein [Nocardia arthritidis]QIS11940.1 SRPBCC family protein [Nocardia arthritidis]